MSYLMAAFSRKGGPPIIVPSDPNSQQNGQGGARRLRQQPAGRQPGRLRRPAGRLRPAGGGFGNSQFGGQQGGFGGGSSFGGGGFGGGGFGGQQGGFGGGGYGGGGVTF